MATTKNAAKTTTKTTKAASYDGFTEAERSAMKDRAKELKARGAKGPKVDPEAEVLAKIAELDPSDRAIAEKIHAIIKANAPMLTPKTWYGMPAYARDGKIVCHFQPAAKFKTRYAMLGFSDQANLDDGDLWPAYYAITQLTPADEQKIAAIVERAAA
ncbi:uncharacterized protein YdhG (YjbR/CyaY superfamily) [Hamadaea flava]|uniref:Iron chaperone n=1 Tax=Hamadaea flava TaxID=1742688 RepID=A0ABV8LSY6_9ACTN|nr:DUF1801 domain-containing protein [Hamadaea flava]MCP2327128.1 uncharacterized protein YdhG (YjbR/CyaY superfamily) [Hamadaea flava]